MWFLNPRMEFSVLDCVWALTLFSGVIEERGDRERRSFTLDTEADIFCLFVGFFPVVG